MSGKSEWKVRQCKDTIPSSCKIDEHLSWITYLILMELVSARTYISKNLRLRKMNETPGSKASGDQCMCQWEEVNCVSIIIEPDSVLLLSWLQSFVGFRGSAIISFPRSPVILECDSQNFEDRFFPQHCSRNACIGLVPARTFYWLSNMTGKWFLVCPLGKDHQGTKR